MAKSTKQHIWWLSVQPGVREAVLAKDILRCVGSINTTSSTTALAVAQAGETGTWLHVIPSILAGGLGPKLNALAHIMARVILEGTIPSGNRLLLERS
jgi:hypothetical protein